MKRENIDYLSMFRKMENKNNILVCKKHVGLFLNIDKKIK